jgi:hypothetical protein
MRRNYPKGRDGDLMNTVRGGRRLQTQPAPALGRETFARLVANPCSRRLGAHFA